MQLSLNLTPYNRINSKWNTEKTLAQQAKSFPTLRPRGPQSARLLRAPLSSRACSDSRPLSQWCHLTISPSAAPFSSCLRSFPASGSFPMSQLFASGGPSIGASASASVLPMNVQCCFPLGPIDLLSFTYLKIHKLIKVLDDIGENAWPWIRQYS